MHEVGSFGYMVQSKYWVFTINNYTEDDERRLGGLHPEQADYLVYGYEQGEEGTPHLQGYIELKKRARLPGAKRIVGPRAHLETRRGTGSQASEYCKKDGNYKEFGEASDPRPGRRTDLEHVVADIREGATVQELWNNHPRSMIMYGRGIKEAHKMLRERSPVTTYELSSFRWQLGEFKVTILWGEPGIGKTEFARAVLPKALFVSHIDDLGRLDETYDGIIFDDMNFSHLPRTAQIHLVDWTQSRSIHIRYGTATIPRETRKLFVTNEVGGRVFDLNDGAIARRVEIKHLQ